MADSRRSVMDREHMGRNCIRVSYLREHAYRRDCIPLADISREYVHKRNDVFAECEGARALVVRARAKAIASVQRRPPRWQVDAFVMFYDFQIHEINPARPM